MRIASVLALLTIAFVPTMQGAPASLPNDEATVIHVLNRLTFGPGPEDVSRVRQKGVERWLEEQLHPERIADAEVRARLERFETIALDSATIARNYFQPAREARRARQAAGNDTASGPRMQQPPGDVIRQERRVFQELAEAKLLRGVYSERQLEEVLVDFWFNHFNVFARKGRTGIYVGEYEREAIRPHVFGKFRDMLGATARHPAMLFYLDNWQSVAPNARMAATGRRPRGLNENYARELLELHTVGVDGGYTQQDIVNVARAFTGWTIGRPEVAGFRFAPQLHDRNEKVVLGQVIKAGGGIEDGERVLDILARHPSTARHISFKLAQRFISDSPPASVVTRGAQAFARTGGDLREVVRAIVTAPEFFADEARRAKIKTPFEFVVSALRAAGADVRNGQAVLRALGEMGMPPYLCQPPTGYDDTADVWVSSGALVNRINFAVALAKGEVRGVQVPRRAGEPLDPMRLGSADFQRQ
jgi:uncharacterized protein (DUF1800 family)